MKKYKRLIVAVILLLALCSCKQKKTPINKGSTLPVKQSANKVKNTDSETDKSFEQIEKHLVWYLDEDAFRKMDPELAYRFNRILLEKGCDFVVDFETHPSKNKEQYDQYQEILRKHMVNRDPVDLIFTGYIFPSEKSRGTYDMAIEDGLLLPLDDYFGNAEGTMLYNAFSDNEWNMLKRDGSIYGVNYLCDYGVEYPLIINKYLFEKYKVELPAEFSLEGVLNAIAEVMNRVENPETILPVFFDSNSVAALYGYYDFGNYWLKKQEDGCIAFENPYEDPEVIEAFNILSEFRKKYGKLQDEEKYSAALADAKTKILSLFTQIIPIYYNENGFFDFPSKVFEPVEQYYSYPEEGTIVGIASWSRYPEEAKRLLMLLATDADLVNALAIGEEGRNYEMFDGRAQLTNKENTRVPNDLMPVNQALVLPIYYESRNKKDRMKKKAAEVFFLPNTLRYEMEYTVPDEENEVNAIFEEAKLLWLGEIDNPVLYVENINERLKKAGWNEIKKRKNRAIYPNMEEGK